MAWIENKIAGERRAVAGIAPTVLQAPVQAIGGSAAD